MFSLTGLYNMQLHQLAHVWTSTLLVGAVLALLQLNHKIRTKLSDQTREFNELQATHAVHATTLRTTRSELVKSRNDLDKRRIEHSRALSERAEENRSLMALNDVLDTQNQELKDQVKLLEAIGTLNGSGLAPRSQHIHNYSERIDAAIDTWMDAHSKFVEMKEYLSLSKAETSNIRRALALSNRPKGAFAFGASPNPRQELGIKAKLFDASTKCEMYLGQLQEATEAREVAVNDLRTERKNTEEAREETERATEALEFCQKEKEDLAMNFELATTEIVVLRSWIQNLLESACVCVNIGLTEALSSIRPSSSLPNIALALAPINHGVLPEEPSETPVDLPKKLEIRPKEALVSSISSSLSFKASLVDLADKENSPLL
ncbi:hypothetical protein BC835DRAFT_1418342 [Cytidiella melzeri]|nr:hypothetical protein BC835DRAFT_1418342 [Cytidiella melzeri]